MKQHLHSLIFVHTSGPEEVTFASSVVSIWTNSSKSNISPSGLREYSSCSVLDKPSKVLTNDSCCDHNLSLFTPVKFSTRSKEFSGIPFCNNSWKRRGSKHALSLIRSRSQENLSMLLTIWSLANWNTWTLKRYIGSVGISSDDFSPDITFFLGNSCFP